ncbi:hypothetical protein [Novosphingobium rosa]|uniref:hypothetical protein n=1 Tax=Novosphingobium rosa TaxID=76978 RepID=UPI0012EEABA3|nr:hypothetical protein [Novosphingobium rosa]
MRTFTSVETWRAAARNVTATLIWSRIDGIADQQIGIFGKACGRLACDVIDVGRREVIDHRNFAGEACLGSE